jgi:hypothetical protein
MAELLIDEPKLQDQVMGDLVMFTRGFTERVVQQARADAPERTGHLKRTLVSEPVRRTGPWSLESGVAATAHYAAAVHEGARPHLIRPRNARALRFTVGGRVVFTQLVRHPGNRSNPFLSRAVHKVASADPRITVGER